MVVNAQEQLERYQHIQEVISAILRFSLEPLSLREQLGRTLEMILAIPWLALDNKGCIFLVDPEESGVLRMVTQQGLPKVLHKNCAAVPFGHCLCGQAAASREMVFAERVTPEHVVSYEGIQEHGHYCIPILTRDSVVLGVINLYVRVGHRPSKSERDFLEAVAHTLAGLIERKRAEEELHRAKEELELLVGKQASSVIFRPALVRQVFDQWSRGCSDHTCWPPPDLHFARIIMETVFVASLRKKEEAPIQACVSLVTSEALLEEMNAYDSILVRFAQPQSFTPETLGTLSPSFDSGNSALVVMPKAGERKELEIVAAIRFPQRGLHRFNAMAFALSPLDIFSVLANKPGHLLIFRGNTIIGSFSSGELSDPTPTSFTGSPMAWNLLRVVQTHPEFQRFDMSYWEVYSDLIDRLLLETARRRKGGTIIWLPKDCVAQGSTCIESRMVMADAPEGVALVARYCELERGMKRQKNLFNRHAWQFDLEECRDDIVEYAEMVSQMTGMDGALIVTDRLRPLSFGSMLTAEPWRGQVVSWLEVEEFFPSVRVDFSQLGARHQSALNFVGSCPGAIAFVISQDGPVAGLARKDDKTIYWWPNCLSQLWEA